jgi:hypothetical protein
LGLGIAFYFSGFFHRMVTAVMADQLMADFNIGAASLGNFSSFYFSALCISLIGWRPSFSCRSSRCGC